MVLYNTNLTLTVDAANRLHDRMEFVNKVYPHLSVAYKNAYKKWMQHAVSHFIDLVDRQHFAFKHTNDVSELYFDTTICGGQSA